MTKIILENVDVSFIVKRKKVQPTSFGNFGMNIVEDSTRVVIDALRGINLRLKDGDRFGLIGPNGSGKSTLLRVCSGSIIPSGGLVTREGSVSSQTSMSDGLVFNLTARQNVYIKCLYLGFTHSEINAIIKEVESISDLGVYFDLPLSTYSKGMRSRLLLSLLIFAKADIVLIDEWINTVDPQGSSSISGLCRDVVGSCDVLLLASHSKRVLKNWCSKLIFLDKGSVVAVGEFDEVYREYAVFRRHCGDV